MNKFPSKSFNPPLSRWQIWLAYVEYEGHAGGKNRPVLVTDIRGSECTIMEITSRPPAYGSDVPIADITYTELNRESVIQTRKKRIVHRGALKKCMGELSSDDIRRVKGTAGMRS